MKTVKIIIVTLMVTVLGFNSFAQMQDHSKMASTKSETLQVSGKCNMCKARIEKAAKLDGVSKAEWNLKSKTLAVTFDPAKTNMDLIAQKVADAGHDNNKVKASSKAYDALDACCKYDRMK